MVDEGEWQIQQKFASKCSSSQPQSWSPVPSVAHFQLVVADNRTASFAPVDRDEENGKYSENMKPDGPVFLVGICPTFMRFFSRCQSLIRKQDQLMRLVCWVIQQELYVDSVTPETFLLYSSSTRHNLLS